MTPKTWEQMPTAEKIEKLREDVQNLTKASHAVHTRQIGLSNELTDLSAALRKVQDSMDEIRERLQMKGLEW